MCTNYRPTSRDLVAEMMQLDMLASEDWPDETWKDYAAPIIRRGSSGKAECLVASYGMVPRRHIPPGVKPWDTMNARTETVGELRSFSQAWHDSQVCLVPMNHFYEPNYESGKAVRWGIGMADERAFAVAGLWRRWIEADGSSSYSFTQLTINADHHRLMKRFHKDGDEKRSLVIIPPEHYEDWLGCRNPEHARAFLNHYPVSRMRAWEEPLAPRQKVDTSQLDLWA
ncbi:SOS response-associated peptidase [Pseudoduganella sp. RAF53_2]|uniref:SOS response-associated peptidase n=1 Tax=unclassified Pseudoduganella TaxID=2637179 RepID=UPI003F943B14